MKLAFTGDEVIQIAVEMEETGEMFYEALAATTGNEQVRSMCRRLARDEIDHRRTFQRLRESFAADWPLRELEPEELDFTQSLINEKILPDPDEARAVASGGSTADAMDMAIRMEADSVRFYSELLAGADGRDAEAIRRIIREEKSHQRMLTDARRGLG